jgi:TIR domain
MLLFISRAGEDKAWGAWAGWHLEAAGYVVRLQEWDFPPAQPIMGEIDNTLLESNAMVALLSEHYATCSYCKFEWQAAEKMCVDQNYLLIPLLIARCKPETTSPLLDAKE